jgi:hypothetical protein
MIPPIRVLNSRFVGDTKEIEHLVQMAPNGVVQAAEWMPDYIWKTLGVAHGVPWLDMPGAFGQDSVNGESPAIREALAG